MPKKFLYLEQIRYKVVKTYLVNLMFRVLHEFNKGLQSSVHSNQITALFFFGKTIDGAGAQHLKLMARCVLRIVFVELRRREFFYCEKYIPMNIHLL